MDRQIEFYFDFASPYAYLAHLRIDSIGRAHHRPVSWHPILLGPIFDKVGIKAQADVPLKKDYFRRDVERGARLLNLAFAWPEPFPFSTVAAGRAFYWIHDRDPHAAQGFAKAVFAAIFAEGRQVADPAVVVAIAREQGEDAAALTAALADPVIKERLRQETAKAEARGVFGAPYFIVDGEPFWGADRLLEIDAWLARGGW